MPESTCNPQDDTQPLTTEYLVDRANRLVLLRDLTYLNYVEPIDHALADVRAALYRMRHPEQFEQTTEEK